MPGQSTETLEYVVSLRGGSEAAADLRRLEGAVGGVGGKVRTLGSDSERSSGKVNGLTGHLKGLAIGLGAVGAAYGVYNAAKGAIDFTRELGLETEKLHHATGMSVEQSSRWAATAHAMNVPGNALGMMFSRMSAAIVKTEGETTKHNSALDKLGISTQFLKEHTGDFNGVMTETIQKLSEYSGLDKPKVQMELFGRGWQSLSPLVSHGGKALEETLNMAKKFGVELKGNTAQQMEELRHRTEEGKFAMDGLRLAFTQMAVGPLGEVIGGFARMANAMREGNWSLFTTEAEKMGSKISAVMEKVVPKVAETAAHLAPVILKSLWTGFQKANLGGEAVIGAVILTKFGLTGAILGGLGGGAGKLLGKAVAGGLAGTGAVFGAAGGAMGAAFGMAFDTVALRAMYALDAAKALMGPAMLSKISVAGGVLGTAFQAAFLAGMATLGFVLGKMLGEWVHQVHFHFDAGRILKGQSPIWVTEGVGDHEHSEAELTKIGKERDAKALARQRAHNPFSYLEAKPKGHAAHGGMVEVGEYGPEMLALPEGAKVAPLDHDGLGNRDIVVQVSGREILRVNAREAMMAAAAGAS